MRSVSFYPHSPARLRDMEAPKGRRRRGRGGRPSSRGELEEAQAKLAAELSNASSLEAALSAATQRIAAIQAQVSELSASEARAELQLEKKVVEVQAAKPPQAAIIRGLPPSACPLST